MRYIKDLHEGETIRNVYLCKGRRSAETRNGKPYDNLILQDKTGALFERHGYDLVLLEEKNGIRILRG